MKKTILLIESSRRKIDSVTQRFSQNGYEVLAAENCMEGLHLFKTHHQQVDVVVIDFYMQSGLTFIHKVEEIKPRQAILTLSSTPYCSSVSGCDQCVAKHNRKRMLEPTDYDRVLKVIQDFDAFVCETYSTCIIDLGATAKSFLFDPIYLK